MAKMLHTIVIGGGQAGLSIGYHLQKRGIPFLILDANSRTGDSWRNRWDSLRLFTPGRYSGLDGMKYPGRGDSFATKDALADYLEDYARHFKLPIRYNTRVEALAKNDSHFVVASGHETFEADNVVVAMANYQVPKTPAFARELDTDIVQMHSHHYRNPSQLRPGGVLVVGMGNSGADIAMEVIRTHPTWISGKESGFIPFPIDAAITRHVFVRLVRFFGHRVLTLSTPIGRRAYPKVLHQASPLIRVKPHYLTSAGVQRVPRVVGVREGKPLLADQRTVDVQNVIWSTGYEPGFSWIKLPVFNDRGDPIHERGIVTRIPGLYFVGLHFLYAMTSATLTGVGRDAERIAKAIASRPNSALAKAA